jgi:hypothetical protein
MAGGGSGAGVGGGGGADGADGAEGAGAGGAGGRSPSHVAAVVAANSDAPGPRAVSSAEPPLPPLPHPPPPATALPLRFVNIENVCIYTTHRSHLHCINVHAIYNICKYIKKKNKKGKRLHLYYSQVTLALHVYMCVCMCVCVCNTYSDRPHIHCRGSSGCLPEVEVWCRGPAREGPKTRHKTGQVSSGHEQGSPHENTFYREHILGYEQGASQQSCGREEGQGCACGLPRGGENATQGSAWGRGGENATRKLQMGGQERVGENSSVSSVPSPYREHILQRTYFRAPPGPCVPSSVPSEPSSDRRSENATKETRKKKKENAIETEPVGLGGHCRLACVGGLGHLVQVRECVCDFVFNFIGTQFRNLYKAVVPSPKKHTSKVSVKCLHRLIVLGH